MTKKVRLLIVLLVDGFVKSYLVSALRRAWLRIMYGVDLGRGAKICRGVEVSRFAELKVGVNCYFGKGVSLQIGRVWEQCEGASIGDRVWISQNTLVHCAGRVSIGSDVLIGEMVSIRDTRHGTDRDDIPIKEQSDVVGSVIIEDDVWIGRGCLILGKPEGVTIGKGSIVGANSVVTKSIPPSEVWAGAPARYIKNRFN